MYHIKHAINSPITTTSNLRRLFPIDTNFVKEKSYAFSLIPIYSIYCMKIRNKFTQQVKCLT